MTQFEAIAKAKELGYDGIEFAGLEHSSDISDEDYARSLKAEADRLELPIVSFVFGADLVNGSNGRTADEEVLEVKRLVDIAEILGVKVIRHDVLWALGKYRSFDAALPELAARVRAITEYASTKGIKTSVENHGRICQDPERCERLFNAVAHENFGILCDIGNFLCADADPAKAVGMVAPYTVFAHAKDFYFKSGSEDNPGEGYFGTRAGNYLKGAIIGHGIVPVKQCLRILKGAGYDGFISIEFEGMEDNIQALRIGLANIRRFISEI
jgi:sugar phosphate isomerase/epimerase